MLSVLVDFVALPALCESLPHTFKGALIYNICKGQSSSADCGKQGTCDVPCGHCNGGDAKCDKKLGVCTGTPLCEPGYYGVSCKDRKLLLKYPN